MELTNRFDEALDMASSLHRTQMRKGTEIPYLSHLMAVAALALEHGADEDTAIAALLHDAVEDAGGRQTAELIRSKFGSRVTEIVLECTDTDVTPKPPWKERKIAYIAHLANASPSGQLVSYCDKLHNARCIVADLRKSGERVWSKFNGGKEGTIWYYRAILETLQNHSPPGFSTEELSIAVDQMQSLS